MSNITLFLLGTVLGSFVNVVLYRLPRGIGFVRGRSFCVSCKHGLKWYDLIPIISYLTLLGRCRYCKKRFSIVYPLVEIYSGFALLYSFIFLNFLGIGVFVFAFFLIEIFLLLGIIDFKYYILPDPIIFTMLLGVVFFGFISTSILEYPISYLIPILDNVIPAIAVTFIFFMLWYLSKGRYLGFGDVKLVGVIALALGTTGTIYIVYSAVILGALTGIVLLLLRLASRSTKLPFGTYLSITATAYVLSGPWLLKQSYICEFLFLLCPFYG